MRMVRLRRVDDQNSSPSRYLMVSKVDRLEQKWSTIETIQEQSCNQRCPKRVVMAQTTDCRCKTGEEETSPHGRKDGKAKKRLM